MIEQMLFCFDRIDAQLSFDSGVCKKIHIIVIFQHIIGDMLYDGRSHLLVYESSRFQDELLRVDLELIENLVLELSSNKLEFADREFLIRTGERGMMQASKAIANTVSGWTMFALNGDNLGVVQKVSTPISQNGLKAGYQFVEYLAPNNCRIRFEVDPMYDDEVRNKIKHPDGGVAMSYRYDIFYTGRNVNGEPNIQKCAINGEPDLRGYEWGLRNPYTGQRNNGNMSHDEDSATIHRMSTLGVLVADPTQVISLIPAILEG